MTINGQPQDAAGLVQYAFKNVRAATVEEVEERQRKWDAIKRDERRSRMESYADIPKRFLERQVDRSGPWGEKLESLKQVIGTGATVVLTGERGPGKTQLAVELIRHAYDKNKDGLYVTATDFIVQIKATFKRESTKSEKDILERYKRPDVLLLDEIGRRQESEWENNVLFELLNSRYAEMRDTIMTCNLPVGEMAANLGPSIMSRMLESGGIVECNWESFRKEKA